MPAPVELPSKDFLDQLFEYKNGTIYWKTTRCGLAKEGSKAGCVNGRGYLVVGINRRKYLVHRIIWAMHGNNPAEVIDHINGNKLDNRIENLRAANHGINMYNAGLCKRNTSGIKGVSWNKAAKKWIGAVWYQHEIYTTPLFVCKEECGEAVRALRCKLHGEFARHA